MKFTSTVAAIGVAVVAITAALLLGTSSPRAAAETTRPIAAATESTATIKFECYDRNMTRDPCPAKLQTKETTARRIGLAQFAWRYIAPRTRSTVPPDVACFYVNWEESKCPYLILADVPPEFES